MDRDRSRAFAREVDLEPAIDQIKLCAVSEKLFVVEEAFKVAQKRPAELLDESGCSCHVRIPKSCPWRRLQGRNLYKEHTIQRFGF